MATTDAVVKAAKHDLAVAVEDMAMIAADLNEAILGAAIAMNNYQRAKARVDLIEAGALLNDDITGRYTNEKQRLAAVKIVLAADAPYLEALESVYETYETKADAEGIVERTRAALSASKRKCEMLVAVARAAGLD